MGKPHPDSGPLYMQAMLSAQKMAADQQEQARQDAFQQQQFEWAQQAYRDAQAQAAPINAQQLENMRQQHDIAQQQWDRYTGTFVPLEDKYIATAQGWDTPEAEQNAAAQAEATVAQQVEQARQASARNLQAYGIDPGAPKYASLDIGTRTAGAAAAAGAGNQAINQRQMEGLQLLQNAAGMGRNLTPTALNAYAGSNASGTGVIGNTNMINSTGGTLMGLPTQYAGLGAQYAGLASGDLGQIGSTLSGIYQGQVQQADAATQGLYGALGMIGGSVMGAWNPLGTPRRPTYAATGGVIDDQASPSRGIETDDVPARLTPGEFVVPKDVVSWKGEEHFQKLIEQAREKRQQAVAVPQVKPAVPTGQGDLPAPSRKQYQLRMLERQGVPEDQTLPSGDLPPGTALPYTQVYPLTNTHSNMPTVTPADLAFQRTRTSEKLPTSFDELGNPHPGMTPDMALRYYRAPPGAYISYNTPSPGRPPMAPQPGSMPPPSPQDDMPRWVIDAMRGGG